MEDIWLHHNVRWMDRPTRLSIINFMVYSKASTVFLKSVNASNNIKDHKYIYKLFEECYQISQGR
ncbi:hypothetical protein VitviT2T_014370 [Vitis vinifera]|uniref:DUF659 domain-containing protein n=1 Tax=Vitis vinifera TaxID=29760 RepID=A0ABY9CJM8_VITVI|nr:hypothetical protein VitviT2T_014370 [Vitis vinifera]